jgi:hypothetical protein
MLTLWIRKLDLQNLISKLLDYSIGNLLINYFFKKFNIYNFYIIDTRCFHASIICIFLFNLSIY